MLLGSDTAAGYTSAATTVRRIDEAARDYEQASRTVGHDGWSTTPTGPMAVRALRKLVDVQERHITLLGGESGHGTLALAELAVAHRRQLVQRHAAEHGPLLGLSLVLLTHELHAAGRFADAIATGHEAIDVLSRQSRVALGGDVRPALVLALDASLMTCLANGRTADAIGDLVEATDLLAAVSHDRPEFRADLEGHLHIVSQALANRRADGQPASALNELARRFGLTITDPAEVYAEVGPTNAVVARSRADELYDDALHLAAAAGDGPAAAGAAGAAVAAYRAMLGEGPAEWRHRTLRRLSRALWRQAIIVNELLGRPRDAMGPGREALALAREIIRVTESSDGFDDLVGELGVTLYDLSHIAAASGLIGEHDQLAEEASRITLDSVGALGLRAVATALHRRAADACETAGTLAVHGSDMAATVAAGAYASGRAVVIRRTLIAADRDPMRRWELANSLLANGHLRCLDGDGRGGAQAMVDAYAAVAGLPDDAGRTMRDAARAALRAACAAHPDVTVEPGWPL